MIKHLRSPLILLMVLGMSLLMLPQGPFAQQPEPIEVFVDIKPGSCPNPINVKSQGVVPVAILGTEDFDVTEIEPASIRLFFGQVEVEGEMVDIEVFPIPRARIEDVATPFIPEEGEFLSCGDCTEAGPDGIADLTLKFRTQDIVKALEYVYESMGEIINDEDCISIELRGELKNGNENVTEIIGRDVVRILKKGRGNKPNIPNRPNWPPPNRPPFLNFPNR